MADRTAGLRVIDVSNPSNPQERGYYNTPGSALGVAVAGSYAYVADYTAGLQIIQFYGGGIEETPHRLTGTAEADAVTVVRGVLILPPSLRTANSSLLSIDGRKVLDLRPGANDVSSLAPGVYFVRSEPSAVGRQPSAVTKVVVAR